MMQENANKVVYSAQPGPQQRFLASAADITFYGGSAGSGKTFALLLEAVRNTVNKEEYHALILRRTTSEFYKPGGLKNEADKMFADFNGVPTGRPPDYVFRNNKKVQIKLDGLQYDDDVNKYKGTQLDFLAFDEVNEFSRYQFFYFLSRMRSVSGEIRPYICATCNPDDNWVLEMIDWWIGQDGYPIEERSGIVRWFVSVGDELLWFDDKPSAEQYLSTMSLDGSPWSFTFIPAKVNDNPIMLARNPDYIAALHNLPEFEKMRLLYGNWRVVPRGSLFKLEWFREYTLLPQSYDYNAIFVDTAQKTGEANDYTVFDYWVRWEGKIYKADQLRGKWTFGEQETLLIAFINKYKPYAVLIEEKANGSALIQNLKRALADGSCQSCKIIAVNPNKDKYSRGADAQPYIENGHVYLDKHADYYPDFVSEVVGFSPETRKGHDDQVDTMMMAIKTLLIDRFQKTSPAQKPNIAKLQQQLNQGAFNVQPVTFRGF